MKLLLPIALCSVAFAQGPPPPGQAPPAGAQPSGPQQGAAAPLTLTLEDALTRAREYNSQFLTATSAIQLARQDTVQARAALFPTINFFNQFIYTQPNGTPSGVFVANDGPHIYSQQLIVHGDLLAFGKLADYRKSIAAQAVAQAKAEVAARGLIATVVQGYFGMLAAQRKLANAKQSLDEALQFLDITTKQEAGGEVAKYDVIKAQIQAEQRRIDAQNAQLDLEKARVGVGVMLFPDYNTQFLFADRLDTLGNLPPFADIQTLANRNNPDIRAAQATVTQQLWEIRSARAAYYPSLTFDYFYGINANVYAIHNPEGNNLLGSAAQATMTVPVWTWGATRSKVKQAEIKLQQAKTDLTLSQRQLLGNLNSFYSEAAGSASQIDALRRMVDLTTESLRLTILRYQAGESTAQEVVDSQTALVQARNALADGLVRYRVAIANLQTLTGTF